MASEPHVQSAPSSAPRRFTLDFVPPFRYACVEDGLYRGAYPVLRNFPFLKNIGIRTILSVTPEPATYDLKVFCKSEQIELKYIQADRHKGEPQLLPTDLNEALNVLVQADNYPIYIHCLDGRHVVGLVIMALRKLQCWDYGAMQLEYERFTKEGNNETAFVMDYAGGLTLPLRVPPWLLHSPLLFDSDGRARRHPTLKIKHLHAPPATVAVHGAPVVSHVPSASNYPSPSLVESGSIAMLASSIDTRPSHFLASTTKTAQPVEAAAVVGTPLTYLDISAIAPLRISTGALVTVTNTTTTVTSTPTTAGAAASASTDRPNTPKKLSSTLSTSNVFSVVPSSELQMLSVRSALCRVDSTVSASNANAWENTTTFFSTITSSVGTTTTGGMSLASAMAQLLQVVVAVVVQIQQRQTRRQNG
ncbi:tyrosine phosphatase-like, putative [Bodo saltans]|uniref:Tyrosine phosphatase-like, putative n=1 Tax=Bodo saltans TaxID=75058 RepID=A0A0S4ILM4_BODSA|nr:tyrosine phosphatase-like, putative [Bodo saltans]|eukprot:CUE71492.1 tyrosine phosphatase-like, putative [Bodo saltans]